MAKKRYYAVRVGRKVGIYKTWEECRPLVEGYSNAEYQGFTTEEEAVKYLGAEKIVETVKNRELSISKHNIAYVDGSYNADTEVYGGGYAVIDDFGIVHTGKATGKDSEMAKMRNVAGELMAVKHAIETAKSLGMKSLSIYYDYEGIKMWATGEWKRTKQGTKAYHAFIQDVASEMELEFVKVKAHSGVAGNELVDKLAKEAVGIR